MPDGGGGAVLRDLREREAQLPIIVMSGLGRADMAAAIAADDIDGFLAKPFTVEQLREQILSALARRAH
jgi:DNA-binding NtrC family response regulator